MQSVHLTASIKLAAFIGLQQRLQTSWCWHAIDHLLARASLLFSHLVHMAVRQTGTARSQLTCQQGPMAVCYSHGVERLWSHSKPPLLYFSKGSLRLCSTSSAVRAWLLPWQSSSCLGYGEAVKNTNMLCHLTSGCDVFIQSTADKRPLQIPGKHDARVFIQLCCWTAACVGLSCSRRRGRMPFAAPHTILCAASCGPWSKFQQREIPQMVIVIIVIFFYRLRRNTRASFSRVTRCWNAAFLIGKYAKPSTLVFSYSNLLQGWCGSSQICWGKNVQLPQSEMAMFSWALNQRPW